MVDNPLTGGDEDGRGRPPHEPSDETRARVVVLAEAGVKQMAIASDVGVSINTLRKHYARELVRADAKVQAMIGQTLLRVALGATAQYYPVGHEHAGKLMRAEQAPDPATLRFLGRTRLGLTDRLIDDQDGRAPEDAEYNTAGITESERITRVAKIIHAAAARAASSGADSEGARRARRPAARASRVGADPGKPSRGGAKQSG